MRSDKVVATILLIGAFALVLLSLPSNHTVYVYLDDGGRRVEMDTNEPHRLMYNSWKECMMNKTSHFRNDPVETWKQIGGVIGACEKPFTKQLKIEGFKNGDETKRHIFPLQNGSSQVIVTMGIGHDTKAEERLLASSKQRDMKMEFFGADPMVEINEALYTKFGKFFPFAVGSQAMVSNASVLDGKKYRTKTVVHIDAVYFLSKLIGKKFFDNIWMDAEGAEYGMLHFFNKGGVFDQNEITICQLNLEIHKPDLGQKKAIRDFLFQTLDDERYAFFNPVQGYHLRVFFVNFADQVCVEKYIPKH